MAINYCETIFPLVESCRNSYIRSCGTRHIHVVCALTNTQWVCRIEFGFFFIHSFFMCKYNENSQNRRELQHEQFTSPRRHSNEIFGKKMWKKHKHSVEGLSSRVHTCASFTSPTFNLPKHKHTHTHCRPLELFKRMRKKKTENTIQLSAWLFLCFVNNAWHNKSRYRFTALCRYRLAGARMKAVIRCDCQPKSPFFFSYFWLWVTWAKWLFPKWPRVYARHERFMLITDSRRCHNKFYESIEPLERQIEIIRLWR